MSGNPVEAADTAASTSRPNDQGTTAALITYFPILRRAIVFRHRMHIASPQASLFESSSQSPGVVRYRAMSEFNVALGRYVIMPDHLHFFVRGDQSFVLGTWVKGLKRAILEAFPGQSKASFWQPGFFDHLLRNDESYAQKWGYVRQNPVRAGLVKFAEDWPHQAEIVYIDRA